MRPLRTAAGELTRLRAARAVYTHGIRAAGELTTLDAGPWPLPRGSTQVTARLAKRAGVPDGFRDVLGLDLRVPLETGPWDLALYTAGPLSRIVPFPASGWCDARYSTLAPYRTGDGLRWLLARAADDQPKVDASLRAARRLVRGGGFELRLSTATATGVPRPLALLRLHILRAAIGEPGFDPMRHHPPGVTLYPDRLSKPPERA